MNRTPHEDAIWQDFKNDFKERFRDVHSDQYNFITLQTARQVKNEGRWNLQIAAKG